MRPNSALQTTASQSRIAGLEFVRCVPRDELYISKHTRVWSSVTGVDDAYGDSFPEEEELLELMIEALTTRCVNCPTHVITLWLRGLRQGRFL